MEKILQLFSGGKDSFLSACRLLDEGNDVSLITYDNGCSLGAENAMHGAERIKEKYGEDKARFLGVYDISGIWRSFFLPFLNLKPSEIVERYGELTVSQFNCLTCRSSMYIHAIHTCRKMDIHFISDGARYCQGFSVETPQMLERFDQLAQTYGIGVLMPVVGLTSDWDRKNELLMRGFIPKTLEPQCLIGLPLPGEKLEKGTSEAAIKFYEQEIMDKANSLIGLLDGLDELGSSNLR